MENFKYLMRLFGRNIVDYWRHCACAPSTAKVGTLAIGLVLFPLALIFCIPKSWIDFFTRKPLEAEVIMSIQGKINALKDDQLEKVAEAASKAPDFFSSSFDSLELSGKLGRRLKNINKEGDNPPGGVRKQVREMMFLFFGDEANNGKKTQRAIYNAVVEIEAQISSQPANL